MWRNLESDLPFVQRRQECFSLRVGVTGDLQVAWQNGNDAPHVEVGQRAALQLGAAKENTPCFPIVLRNKINVS